MLIVIMLNLLFLCPALLVVAVQTLTIDSHLGTSVEDCFERISIGEQLPPDAIYRNISELTTRECDQLCKLDKQCQTYDYGVGAKGNATCNLSTLGEKELREQNLLRRHPDYDIYVRRFQCEQQPPSPLQPQFDEENPPLHRPVFRPDEDEPKNPLSDDFLSDLRPFETDPMPTRPYRPHNNHIDSDRPDDYDNSKPDFDRPPSYGAHRPPEIPYKPYRPDDPYRPERPKPDDSYRPERPPRPDDPYRPRPDDSYRPERPLRPNDPYRPNRPFRPNDPYELERPITPDDPYRPDRPLRPDVPYGPRPDDPYRPERPARPEKPYGPQRPEESYRPQRPDDPYRPQRPYRPGYPDKPYNHSKPKPDPYDVLQFQDHYGRPPRPDPESWRPDPHYPPASNDDIPDLYGQKPIRPERPPYKPEKPEYHYIVRPNKKPVQHPQDDPYKPAQDPYKPDYGSNRPDPYLPNKPEPYPDSGYGNKPSQDYQSKPDGYKPKPDPYGSSLAGPIGPLERPNRPSRPNDYAPSRPYEKPSYSYNSQYASGYGQNQDNSIYVEIYDPPRPYKPMKPLHDKPGYSEQSYGQNYGHGQGSHDYSSYSSSYGPIHNSHLYYGTHGQSGLYGQNYHKPIEHDIPENPHYSQGSYGSQTNHDFDQSSGYGSHKPQDNKPAYGSSQGAYGQNNYNSDQYDSQNYGENRPSYSQDKPPYDTSHNRPSYGGNQNDPPSYGGSQEKPPSYGSQEKPPSYGGNQEKPANGGSQNYDSNQSYGNQKPTKPSYGSSPGSYGNNDGPDNSYGGQNYDQSNRPGYEKPNETDYRPDVRPVYEYELDKPGDVPSYIVRPNGDIVTSRPVTVGDYANRPGYGEPSGYEDKPGYGDAGYREKGKLSSYKGESKT